MDSGFVARWRALLQRRFQRRWRLETEFLDGFLRNVTGVVHVGANLGQEREFYRVIGNDVVWVEPISEVFQQLSSNIASFAGQQAHLALLGDEDGKEYEFKIANNNGASSSILPMDKHAELWPEIEYVETRRIKGTTLEAFMRNNHLSTRHYQALVIDVEGAELLVLKGAGATLGKFQYVKAEVADFTPRAGSPVTEELTAFMQEAGFEELIRRPFADHPTGGTYWDIVWRKKQPLRNLYRPKVQLPLTATDISGWEKIHS